MFDVLMTGVGDAFSRVHWGTHFLVQRDDFLLAIDCPDSYRRALHESGLTHRGEPLDVNLIDAMILTHLHGDHVNGLEMALCYRRFSGGGLLPLYASDETLARLWPRLEPSLHVLWDGQTYWPQTLEMFLSPHELPWGEAVTIGPLTITTRPTQHHLRASAMRISDGSATLGYSCDTAYDPELIAWLSDCDLILHESSTGPAHTPMTALQALPEAIRQKLRVVHYPDQTLEDLPQGLTLARQGERLRVG